MNFKKIWSVVIAITTTTQLQAQLDTVKNLKEITLVGKYSKSDYEQMPEIVGTNIYAGKKNALIILDNVHGNVASNTMRQVLAKVPGIHVWESDPSGIQIGIAARGLSPNRSWEFNVRQNGYDISADPYGYPEAYYNPQLQSVQRIEVVRGQAALQYGPQFGGMVNYILKNGSDITKPIQFETQQTYGSNQLFNSYNAIGGQTNKVHYYAFFDHRDGNGYRNNSSFFSNAGFATVTYKLNNKFKLNAEYMHSNIRSQQPGGLTDAQIQQDNKQSFRSRNWFDITWKMPALTLNYEHKNVRWITKASATLGDRNSVGFLQPITVGDTINKATGKYANRAVNADYYRNFALESRVLYEYNLGNTRANISTGIRLYTGNTHRLTDGKGTTGSDYDMQVIGNYGKDINFASKNAAVFAENIFKVGKKILIIPGIRYEYLSGKANGRNGYEADGVTEKRLQNIQRSRTFLLAGIALEYHTTPKTELYANITQAYRPIQFANLSAPPTTDVIDPNLKDAKGYNADLGFRGKLGSNVTFDVSAYYLQYNNRVGTITPAGATYRLVTNVGASTSKGIETMVDMNIGRMLKSPTIDLNIYASHSYTQAKYGSNFLDSKLANKQVENAPAHILRSGMVFKYKSILLSGQFSAVSQTFSDATNTVAPTANAQAGIIPAYQLIDATAGYTINKNNQLKAGLNNIANVKYFTRRAGGYPGPGALPGDGRNFFVSLTAKF